MWLKFLSASTDDAFVCLLELWFRLTKTLAQWHWSKRAVSSAGWLSRAGEWVKFKLEVVLSSLLAFLLISTVTAMTVRTLLSSGVVIMFPLVMLMERMGLTIVGVHVRMGRDR